MRKAAATNIVARRLGIEPGRAEGLVQKASDAGLLPKAVGKAIPDLSADELATLFIAVLVDRGLGNVPATVKEFSRLGAEDGTTFHSAIVSVFEQGSNLAAAATGSLIARLDPASVSLTVGGLYNRYGPEPSPSQAGRHVLVPGRSLAAIGLEFAGNSPADADTLVALARVSASAGLGVIQPRVVTP